MAVFTKPDWTKIRELLEAEPDRFGLPRPVYGSSLLGSFNIRKLGAASKRNEETWRFLADTCRPFDLLAVQEILDDLSGLRKLAELMGQLAAKADIEDPLFEVRPVEKRLFVLITSDKGLCGSYNMNTLKLAQQAIDASVAEGVEMFVDAKALLGPGKAANAGGVAVSGLEMAQNSMRYSWTRKEVDDRLQLIMKDIHAACLQAASRFDTPGNYVNGANIAGFIKVADAMLDQGVV